jgi:hypothetical protein
MLVLAVCFFASSIGVDVLQHHLEPYLGEWRILLEDGFKLFGIVSWCGYFSTCCYEFVTGSIGLEVEGIETGPEIEPADVKKPALL